MYIYPRITTIPATVGIGLAACSDSVFGTDARYKLYPTQNMYNFILLDQIDGDTYQVQWGKEENRMLMQISK